MPDPEIAFLMDCNAAATAGSSAGADLVERLRASARAVLAAGRTRSPRVELLAQIALVFAAETLREDLAQAMQPLLSTIGAQSKVKRHAWQARADIGG